MATRSNTTFQKRQKEQARMEKAREKAAKRAHRKLHKGETPAADETAPGAESTDGTIAAEEPPTNTAG